MDSQIARALERPLTVDVSGSTQRARERRTTSPSEFRSGHARRSREHSGHPRGLPERVGGRFVAQRPRDYGFTGAAGIAPLLRANGSATSPTTIDASEP